MFGRWRTKHLLKWKTNCIAHIFIKPKERKKKKLKLECDFDINLMRSCERLRKLIFAIAFSVISAKNCQMKYKCCIRQVNKWKWIKWLIHSTPAKHVLHTVLTVQFDIVLEKLWLLYIYLFIWKKNKKEKYTKKRKQVNLPQQTHQALTTCRKLRVISNWTKKKVCNSHSRAKKTKRIKINTRHRHILSGLYLRFHACRVYFNEVLNITISYFF